MLSGLRSLWQALWHRSNFEKGMDDELLFHIESRAEELLRAGHAKEEARRLARIEFGGLEGYQDRCRESRRIHLFDDFVNDARYAARVLAKNPGFTVVAVLTLALGIGANTAIFSLIDTVMLRMLPVRQPEQLMLLKRHNPKFGDPSSSLTYKLWEQVREHQDVFSGAFAWSDERFNLSSGGAVNYANGTWVSGDYFSTLGLQPALGRFITPADDAPGCAGAAVLSYGFWQQHFGGDPKAVGGLLALENHSFPIVGVAPQGFYGMEVGQKFDVAIPICSAAIFDGSPSRLDHRSWWWLRVAGRRKPDLNAAQVQARLAVLSPEIFSGAVPDKWDQEGQERFRKMTMVAAPAGTGVSYLRAQFGEPLRILMAVVGIVLLVACANIASLMLARGAARRKEIAMRRALGASRGRLIRQLVTECVVLSLAGAAFGILLAPWGTALLVRYISTTRDHIFLDFPLDFRVLGFTIGVAILTAILFGVLPALRSTRVSLTSAMKGIHADDSDRRGKIRPGKWIVSAQVALSLVLLVTAGLFLRSLVKLVNVNIGFDRNNVLLVNANLKTAGVPDAGHTAMFGEIERRIAAVPGVVSVGRSLLTPLSQMEWNQLINTGLPGAPQGDDSLVFFNFISPGYFPTMRTPILAGRNFTKDDTKTSLHVAIVNETLVRKFFPGVDPLGKTYQAVGDPGKPEPVVEIVGVVADAKYDTVREATYATSFLPATQIPENDDSENFEVRTLGAPAAMIPVIQDSVGGVSKTIPLEFHTLARQVDDSLVQERLLATLSGFFGGLALLLATIGLYGALSYFVAQRRTEFGVRMALGAQPASILRLVLRDVGLILSVGVIVGAGISLLSVGGLQKFLFGLDARDPLTLIGAIFILSAVAFIAGYLPARRAMKVDPMVALRYE